MVIFHSYVSLPEGTISWWEKLPMKSSWAPVTSCRCQGRGSLKSLNAKSSCRMLDPHSTGCMWILRCGQSGICEKVILFLTLSNYDLWLSIMIQTHHFRIMFGLQSCCGVTWLDLARTAVRSGPWMAKPKPFWKRTVTWCRCRRSVEKCGEVVTGSGSGWIWLVVTRRWLLVFHV